MTKLLDEAVERVRRLPAEQQDEVARAMLALSSTEPVEEIPSGHLADVLEGLAQARRREFASDEAMDSAFRGFIA